MLSWWQGRQQLYFCLQSTEQKTKKLQFDAINNNKIPGLCGGGAIFQLSIMTNLDMRRLWVWNPLSYHTPSISSSVSHKIGQLTAGSALCFLQAPVQCLFRISVTAHKEFWFSLVLMAQSPAAAYVRCIHSNWKRPQLWQIFQLSLARVHECLA